MDKSILNKIKELQGFEFCIWLYVKINTDENKIFTQSNEQIAEFFGRHRIAISALISKMINKGFLEAKYGYQGYRELKAK